LASSDEIKVHAENVKHINQNVKHALRKNCVVKEWGFFWLTVRVLPETSPLPSQPHSPNRQRRVIAKAEHLEGKENPRFVVTSLTAQMWPAQKLYEELYCARGDMENRIKEQLSLFADRVSSETMRANQVRMYFSAMAYTLLQALRRLGLEGTDWAQAQCSTIRLKLLKIGALIQISVCRIHLLLASGYPHQELFRRVYHQLQAVAPEGLKPLAPKHHSSLEQAPQGDSCCQSNDWAFLLVDSVAKRDDYASTSRKLPRRRHV
jgi:hypothetical protein